MRGQTRAALFDAMQQLYQVRWRFEAGMAGLVHCSCPGRPVAPAARAVDGLLLLGTLLAAVPTHVAVVLSPLAVDMALNFPYTVYCYVRYKTRRRMDALTSARPSTKPEVPYEPSMGVAGRVGGGLLDDARLTKATACQEGIQLPCNAQVLHPEPRRIHSRWPDAPRPCSTKLTTPIRVHTHLNPDPAERGSRGCSRPYSKQTRPH